MGFKKYSTVPLEVVADDQGHPSWVKEAHKDEQKERQTIGSATREGAGSSAIRNDPGFPDHIRRVLDMYRVS